MLPGAKSSKEEEAHLPWEPPCPAPEVLGGWPLARPMCLQGLEAPKGVVSALVGPYLPQRQCLPCSHPSCSAHLAEWC